MGQTTLFDTFLNLHRVQLMSSGVPEQFWYPLFLKLSKQTFDAGNAFQLLKIDYDEERQSHEPIWGLQAICDIKKSDGQHVYLVDHAWTFRVQNARKQLLEYPNLRARMANILGLNSDLNDQDVIEEIFKYMWKACNTYSISNTTSVEDRLPVWYIMDEIGSAVMHNDTPNCRIVPFVYINDQTTYSILFPIEDIDEESFIFRDYAEGIVDTQQRAAALIPWVPHSFEDVPTIPPIPGPEYYLSGHVEESLPDLTKLTNTQVVEDKFKVYSEYDLIKEHLTHNKFEIVDNPENADILWYTHHFKDFAELSGTPNKYVNQFPFEYVITIKDLLCLTCRRTNKGFKLSPVTYNLKTELTNFLSYFQKREKEGQDNYWIIKPYNLARGMDIHITNNLDYITRLSATGPKIAQKYIIDPVLFYRPECQGKVKFDIRYVIFLKSVKPLKAYAYKNFFLRFANVAFELNDFDDYEKHFTVMNYTETAILKHMLCSEFKQNWEQQFANISWDEVEKSVYKMLKEILDCAVREEPPCGIAHSPQSRALYAADLMLEWDEKRNIQPRILEINWTPDCKRACDYYPDFYNDAFELLFLNSKPDVL